MKKVIFMFCLALGFSACALDQRGAKPAQAQATQAASSDVVVQKVDKDDVRNIIREEKMLANDTSTDNDLTFTAVGEGIAPLNTVSVGQALALAKRAAITDAYRQLASKLYGVRVNGKDTVKDAMLKSSTITAQVNGLIKNASVVDQDFKDGLYRVNVELKIDADKWKELFAY
ncbi:MULTISPECIES: LPP20 family lipoprotein [Campylobacter]|uniref:Lipoprotein required for motility n=1 Tax=Campylobacter lari TaxID=201 RepID=A0A5L4RNZ7_CAMLA|nr:MULTISPECIES: lipoprotein required for motility [Campylobacter]EAH6869366.1 lipoprotein required for motility [Campylobacter lari]EAI4429715.1 lipoprotein required for motility [Campylobacter lari]EAI5530262.1 lipoprotein required for motility [Campylobacter lari]EAJ0324844.1 lipoprotein required for motility [Campylobacter lari]EAJ0335631.1 lipoprotein required for motility [Campylobacter lari]